MRPTGELSPGLVGQSRQLTRCTAFGNAGSHVTRRGDGATCRTCAAQRSAIAAGPINVRSMYATLPAWGAQLCYRVQASSQPAMQHAVAACCQLGLVRAGHASTRLRNPLRSRQARAAGARHRHAARVDAGAECAVRTGLMTALHRVGHHQSVRFSAPRRQRPRARPPAWRRSSLHRARWTGSRLRTPRAPGTRPAAASRGRSG